MGSDLTTALVISGVGLLMLFAALAILYGLIYAMTAFIKDRPEAEVKGPPRTAGADTRAADVKARVAVLAVAR
jgi:Na+-transporting methylmalonyl-CoA/oxaloacetate decarboxylase gamma subunit